MRKFTKFFMLLFALVGATEMSAQNKLYTLTPGERVTTITAGQQYMIYNSCAAGTSNEAYAFILYYNGSNFAGLKNINPSAFSVTGTEAELNKYIFEAETGSVDGTFALKNVASNSYAQGTTTPSATAQNLLFYEWASSSENKAEVASFNHTGSVVANSSITSDDKVWVIVNNGKTSTDKYWSGAGGNAPKNWESAQPFAIYTINKVEETSISIPINFTDTKTGNTFTLADQVVAIGSNVSDAVGTHTFYTINSITDQDGAEITTFASTTTALNVSVTSDFPFEVMTINGENFGNANFYTMQINSGRDMVYEEGTGITTVANTKGFNKKSLWAFELVSGTENEFKIYNFAAGTSSLLTVNGNGNGTTANMSSTPPGSTGAQQFKLAVNGTGWAFIHPQTTNVCLNTCKSLVNSTANTGLGLWSGLDGGACINFASVDDMVPETNFYGGISADPSYTTEDGYVTMPNTETINALYSYNNNKTASWLEAAIDKVAATEGFDLNDIYNLGTDAAKIYQIIAYADSNKDQPIYANPGQTATGGIENDNRNLYTSATAPVAQTAMLLVKDGANYYIEHANSEYWFPNIGAGDFQGTPDLPNQKGFSAPYTIHTVNWMTNVFGLKIASTDKWLVSGAADNKLTTVTEDPTTANENAGNPAGFWLIKEIKSIPVTIGAAKWSTLCLPVAVTVPNDESLKVYTVSGVDNGTGVMTLDEVAAGTVVAKKTGLLLASKSENESDTYNFAVSTEAGTSYEGSNILMGTTARRIGFNTGSAAAPADVTIPHYALAQQDGVVAFYPSTLNILPANKAYIKKADIPTGDGTNRALYMTGETTGMNNALIQNGEAEEYYDLNGRRVLYPTTGIYATRSGKKVFIK